MFIFMMGWRVRMIIRTIMGIHTITRTITATIPTAHVVTKGMRARMKIINNIA
jgi:hypothetical protein